MRQLPLLQSLPLSVRETLRQPSCWAAIASVGFHGLMWVLLPILPLSSAEPKSLDDSRTVDLVELSPEEMSRLPDLSPPTSQLPMLEPDADDLYSFSNPRSNRISLDPIQPSRPRIPSFPSLYVPSAPPIDLPSSVTQPRPQPRSVEPEPEEEIAIVEPNPEETPTEPANQLPDLAPAEPSDFSGETQELSELQALADPEAATEESSEESTAEPSTSPSETLLAEQQALQELFTYNSSGTKTEEADIAFGKWFLDELGQEGEIEDEQQIAIAGSYSMAACRILERQETKSVNAAYGIVVDAEGQLAPEPRLILSSGYGYFNQSALQAIESYEFENETGAEQIYLVNVVFEYSEDLCSATIAPEDAPAG